MSISVRYPAVLPSLNLNFAKTKRLDPRITFTRSSTGTYVDEDGIIRIADINTPRFTHDPVTKRSLGLLVEEARTNLLLQSEEFDNASWTKSGLLAFGSGSTANATSSPSGQVTADLLTEDTSTGTHQAFQNFTTASGVTYTFSCFVKRASGSRNMRLAFGAAGMPAFTSANVDLSSGAIDSTAGSPVATSISALSNGWFRVSLTQTASGVSGAASVQIGILSTITGSYTGDGASGVYLWGAQLEAGAFPTSYIPTTGTAATRAADIATITGANFSRWYNQGEGTVYMDVAGVNGGRFFMFDNGGTSERWEGRYTSQIPTLSSWSASSQDVAVNSGGSVTNGVLLKLAAANQSNNAGIASDGRAAVTDSASTMPSGQTRLHIGSFQSASTFLNGSISRFVYWPRRLPDYILQELTR